MTMSPTSVLRTWFPDIAAFRDRQHEAITRLSAGSSTLLLMPTGKGKSLVYQIPVLASGGVGVVISPLVALMREQADKLNSMNIQALSLGGLELREAQDALRNFSWNNGPGFLFTSPERAETDGFLEYLLRLNRSRITVVAIDEAHCISQWGHDFRPPYKSIPLFLDRVFGRANRPAILCMTATLNKYSEAEICDDFELDESDVLRSDDMIRENLRLSFKCFDSTDEKIDELEKIIESNRGQKIIIYAHLKHNKRAGTRALAFRLRNSGHRACAYDADMPLQERDRIMADFTKGEIDVVCATGAFGMGIDIKDIRGVIHFLLPESIEQYYQEVGRAGRDGKCAFGILLYTHKNAKVRQHMIESSRTSADSVKALWNDVITSARVDLRSLSPNDTFQGREDDYALFYAFQRVKSIRVVARGPTRINAFEPCSPRGAEFLETVRLHSRIGHFPTAFRKAGQDPVVGYSELFNLYYQNEIKLIRSPVNSLIFRMVGLSDELAEEIARDVNSRIDKRLEDFDRFRTVIENTDRPDRALREHFGSG